MTPLPLAMHADASQVERLRPMVEGRTCVVIGSAPLSTKYADVRMEDIIISVNGGISSVAGPVDLWVVNSKAQDQPGAAARPLHRTMLEQGKGRIVRRALFLRGPKVPSEHWTLETLRRMGCEVIAWSVLDKPTKRWMEGECCGRIDEKKPCSSGILAVACALWAGAASVRLVGFSFKPGYHYLPKERPQAWWRDHIAADQRALSTLCARYGDRVRGDLVRSEVAA